MAMFVKMVLAFLLSVCLAGAIVYFGTANLYPSPTTTNTGTVQNSKPSFPRAKLFLDKFTKKNPANIPPEKIEQQQTSSRPQTGSVEVGKGAVYSDKNAILMTLMTQAKRIKSKTLKDQAYLDIVDYAVNVGRYDEAYKAMKNIDQIELRDTARGSIAISMARSGQADSAFDIIDQVEIDTLRDVMRLQVIEAIAIPDRLPPRIQR